MSNYNIRINSKLLRDNSNYNNKVGYYYGSFTKKYKPEKIIFNSHTEKYNHYIRFLKNFLKINGYEIDYKDDDYINLVIDLENAGKLYCLTSELLEVALSCMLHFISNIRCILLPKEFHDQNIGDYYYFKDGIPFDFMDEKIADKFFMRDQERITFENNFVMNHHEEYQRLTDYKILDALHTSIVYYYDSHEVINEDDLTKYLEKLMRNQKDFEIDMKLNNIEYLNPERDWMDNKQSRSSHERFLLFTEYYCKNNIDGKSFNKLEIK